MTLFALLLVKDGAATPKLQRPQIGRALQIFGRT